MTTGAQPGKTQTTVAFRNTTQISFQQHHSLSSEQETSIESFFFFSIQGYVIKTNAKMEWA